MVSPLAQAGKRLDDGLAHEDDDMKQGGCECIHLEHIDECFGISTNVFCNQPSCSNEDCDGDNECTL